MLLTLREVKVSGFAIMMDVLSSMPPFSLATPHRVGPYEGQYDANHLF